MVAAGSCWISCIKMHDFRHGSGNASCHVSRSGFGALVKNILSVVLPHEENAKFYYYVVHSYGHNLALMQFGALHSGFGA